MFEVASELDVALTTRGAQWRALIAQIKGVYKGGLFLAANTGTLATIDFWDALDAVGVDAYYYLGSAELPLGIAPAVDDLVAAWEPIKATLANLSASLGKPILFTEVRRASPTGAASPLDSEAAPAAARRVQVGYQSRPSCHVRPWGTVVHDPLDDSAWLEDHDMACQVRGGVGWT